MSNYYQMRDAKVNIAHQLMNRGWDVKGYKKDESDSMTDYYSPAHWSGVATKNGFVLCVDTTYEAKSEPIRKYNHNSISFSDQEKIKKLEALTQDRGATAGEEANAKAFIEKIKNNTSDISEYEITGYTIAHMANPGKCKWHIEKDGSIYDKGTGITKYSDIPDEYVFDINTMKYKAGHDKWSDGEKKVLSEDELKAVKDLKTLILRWERVINSENGMGDGTKETEQQAQEQNQNEKMEKVIVKETKTVLKMVEVTDRKEIKVGDFLTIAHHGHYWKVTSEYMQKATWNGVTERRKAFVYEIVGSASRGYQALKNPRRYYDYEFRMMADIEKGKTKIFELKEVEEVTEVEKWVRVKPQNNVKKENIKTDNNRKENTVEEETTVNYNFTITKETDTRNGSDLWVVRLSDKLEKEDWRKYHEYMKSNKGYYSKFKGGHIFKFDPTDTLKTTEQEEQKQENNSPYEQDKIEEGYLYNCHFKEWNIPITQIQSELFLMNIPYNNMGDKVGFENVDYKTMLLIEELNNRNESILFIDSKIKLNSNEIINQAC